mgnify:CR=1 FL=1
MIGKGKKVKASVQSCWTIHASEGTSTEVSLDILAVAKLSSTPHTANLIEREARVSYMPGTETSVSALSMVLHLTSPIYPINVDCIIS